MMGEFDGVAEAINESVDSFKQTALERSSQSVKSMEAANIKVKRFTLLCFAIVIFIYICSIIFITAIVVRPIRIILKKLKLMADNSGDLTQRIDYSSKDEIGALSDNFNKMQESFRILIQEVIKISRDVDAGSEETKANVDKTIGLVRRIDDGTTNISSSMEENAAATEEVTAITNELDSDIRGIADTARKDFAVVASQIGRLAQDSAKSVEEIRTVNETVLPTFGHA